MFETELDIIAKMRENYEPWLECGLKVPRNCMVRALVGWCLYALCVLYETEHKSSEIGDEYFANMLE